MKSGWKEVLDGLVNVLLAHLHGVHAHHVGQVLPTQLELGPLGRYEGIVLALLIEVVLQVKMDFCDSLEVALKTEMQTCIAMLTLGLFFLASVSSVVGLTSVDIDLEPSNGLGLNSLCSLQHVLKCVEAIVVFGANFCFASRRR